MRREIIHNTGNAAAVATAGANSSRFWRIHAALPMRGNLVMYSHLWGPTLARSFGKQA